MINTKTARIAGFRCTPEFKKEAQELADKTTNGNLSKLFETLVDARKTGFVGGSHMTPFVIVPNVVNDYNVISEMLTSYSKKKVLNFIYGITPEGKTLVRLDQDSLHYVDTDSLKKED